MPSTRAPNTFQEIGAPQNATRRRANAKHAHNNLPYVPAVSLAYTIIRESRRGGRLRPLLTTPTKEIPTPAQGLCLWCTNRLHRLDQKYFHSRHFMDIRAYKDMRRDAKGGCHICCLLFAGVTAAFGQIEKEDWHIETSLVMDADILKFTPVINVWDREVEDRKTFQFCSPQGDPHFKEGSKFVTVDRGFMPTPLNSLAIPKEVVADMRVDECVNIASQWISKCREGHRACRRQQLSRLPTRVIDVGLDHQDCPKLLECDAKSGRYIALSHCWGSGRHFTTETTNINERMKGMRWELLPKTFQDAISITRKLKIRYLWIDSLCILQNDSADWDKELSKMSDIYKNSYLTIAAVSAGNDQAGFLGSKLWHLPISLPPLKNFCSDVKIWQAMDYREYGTTKEPLESRAWAFQERLVTQRVLFFGSKQMRWECNSSTWSEVKDYDIGSSGRELYYNTLRPHVHPPPKSRKSSTLVGTSEEPEIDLAFYRSQIYHWWRTYIIGTYANLQITKEEDRLPALSAIANDVNLEIQDVYLAGLWKQDLLLGLIWLSSSKPNWPQVDNTLETIYAEPGYLPKKYRAPSWSWASIESNALGYSSDRIMKGQEKFTAQILEAECQVSGINTTGEVSGGFIRLSARWFPAKLHVAAVKGMQIRYAIKRSHAAIPAYDTPGSEVFWPDTPIIKEPRSQSNRDKAFEASVQRSTLTSEYSCPVRLGAVSCVMIATLDSGFVAFLVLGRASGRTGAFERLGVFRIHHGFLPDGWYDSLSAKEFLIV